MSYCRWSNDDFQCDVYVYEDVNGGWTTLVAGNRIVWDIDVPPPAPEGDIHAEIMRMAEVMKLLDNEDNYHRVPTPGGVNAFNHDTPGECADNLESLREQGFQVPQYAIDALRAEQRDPSL